MKLILSLLSFVLMEASFASATLDSNYVESPVKISYDKGTVYGTLMVPDGKGRFPVVLIIAGSGPTDRNGNGPMLKTDAYKQLARVLANNNIASLRYDKRLIGESATANVKEEDLRFEMYADDAISWVKTLRSDKRFDRVFILGHSEGSLLGMLAANDVDGFISVAGPGQRADFTIKEQFAGQPASIRDQGSAILDRLAAGKLVTNVDPLLRDVFRPSIQPYMISWFKYDPQVEIKKLKIPVLLVQGTEDLQVKEKDARLLSAANPSSKLVIIKGMNHVLKIVSTDHAENIKSYNDPSLPVSTELVAAIREFINKR